MRIEPRITSCGDDAVTVSNIDKSLLRALAKQLRGAGQYAEVVDGGSDFTVLFNPLLQSQSDVQRSVEMLIRQFENINVDDSAIVSLRVAFGGEYGPDLSSSAATLGLSEHELISCICDADLHVDMLGFTPGFAYIHGLPESIHLPRRTSPRPRVPAGSIGTAAGMLGTYALPGPGGWQLLGRIIEPLFDANRDSPFLLQPGMRVRLKLSAS